MTGPRMRRRLARVPFFAWVGVYVAVTAVLSHYVFDRLPTWGVLVWAAIVAVMILAGIRRHHDRW